MLLCACQRLERQFSVHLLHRQLWNFQISFCKSRCLSVCPHILYFARPHPSLTLWSLTDAKLRLNVSAKCLGPAMDSGLTASNTYNETSERRIWKWKERTSVVNLLRPEKLKALYSLVHSAAHVDRNKEMNKHDDASDICWHVWPSDTDNV